MTPDRRARRSARPPADREPSPRTIRAGPSSDDPHAVVYFRRHPDDDPDETIPGRAFLRRCPPKVRATIVATLVAVATAPPKRFAGGGYWEAMRGGMAGWFEVRVDGPNRRHYRVFCLIDHDAIGETKPLLVVIDGLDKAFRTTASDAAYRRVRALGDEYRSRNPRSLA